MLLRDVLAYALGALCALGAAAALPGVSVSQAGGGFYEQFDGAHGVNDELFAHSGYWSNGQPFNSGWDPSYWTVQSGIMFLGLRKERFHRGNWDLPYTGGEIQTHAQYGAGCYSVCMKAPPQIGVTAGFFIQNFGEGGNYKGAPQNEIDVGT
jgi:beta-glucanase (GH16 family)